MTKYFRFLALGFLLFPYLSTYGQEITLNEKKQWIQDYTSLVINGWVADTLCDSTFSHKFRNYNRGDFIVSVVLKKGFSKEKVEALIGKPNAVIIGKYIRWEYYLNTSCKEGKYIKNDDSDNCWLEIRFSKETGDLHFASMICE